MAAGDVQGMADAMGALARDELAASAAFDGAVGGVGGVCGVGGCVGARGGVCGAVQACRQGASFSLCMFAGVNARAGAASRIG